MLQMNNSSDSSSSSSDSDSENERENKVSNNHNNQNKSNTVPSNNRKRKISNLNSNSTNNNDSLPCPPKKRLRTNNITINTQIENEDTLNTNTNTNNNRKRKKKNENKTKKKKKRKKADTPIKKPVDGVKIEELECIVCRELPPNKIYQCVNSHLLCDKCYARVCEGIKCICPECRVKMSRREPSRNKLAENYLSAHLFDCLNAERGCKDRIQFCYLSEHSNHECKYRSIECKFSVLGCEWKGLAKDRSKHNKICGIKKTDAKKILKLVSSKNALSESKSSEKQAEMNKYVNICKLFEMRAKNVCVRDIRIGVWNENSKKKTEVINSNYFSAMSKRWQFQLKIEKISQETKGESVKLNKLWIRLQCMAKIRKRIPFEICIFKGPDFGYRLSPIKFECEMTKNVRDSKWVSFVENDLLFSDEEVKNKFFTNYHTENKINLRVLMFDKRVNGVSHEFGGMNDDFNDNPVSDGFGGFERNRNRNSNSNNNGGGNGGGNDDEISSYSSLSSSDSSSSSNSTQNSAHFSSSHSEDIYSDLDDYSSSEDFY